VNPLAKQHNSVQSGTWAARGREEHYLRDIGRSDLRRTSLSLTLAASTAGDPEEFVHLALSGEMVAALRLCRFTETALCAWETEAAATLGIRTTQISRECAYLSKSLGTEIFARRMPNGTRELTPTGTALYNLARANIDKLRRRQLRTTLRRLDTEEPRSRFLQRDPVAALYLRSTSSVHKSNCPRSGRCVLGLHPRFVPTST